MRKDDPSRPNLAMALIVDHGIALAATAGNVVAAAYLAERHVPDAVIARVLCDPDRRRVSARPQVQPSHPHGAATRAAGQAPAPRGTSLQEC
jgi:hypothetical protein